MDKPNRKALIDAWIAMHKADASSRLYDQMFWAYQAMDRLTDHDPLTAWDLILDILKHDSSLVITNAIGAGPLEDLLCRHGEMLIEHIESEAPNNRSLRDALRVVDIWEEDTPVHDRFYAIECVDFPPDREND